MTSTGVTSEPTPWATSEFGLRLHDGEGNGDWLITTLVRPGLRRNPRRAHLLVSTVLGKHIPVEPELVRSAADALADRVRTCIGSREATQACVIGFAETATGLGNAVAVALGAASYLHSTRRHTPDAPVLGGFEEGHSHATSHLLQPTTPNLLIGDGPLVLVDDEISTGATAIDAIRTLHTVAPRTHYVIASLVDMSTPAHKAAMQQTAHELGIRIEHVALACGRVDLPADLIDRVSTLADPAMNPVSSSGRGTITTVNVAWPEHVPDGGRYGVLGTDHSAFAQAAIDAATSLAHALDRDRPLIVIGHEELMYLPFCLAEELAAMAYRTRYQTTTRSPAYVHPDPMYPLQRGFRFHAPEPDPTAARYLYNALWPGTTARETQLLVVIDSPADTTELRSPAGLLDVLTAAGHDVIVAVVPAADFHKVSAHRSNG